MLKEMSLKQAMVLLGKLESERYELTTTLRRKYRNEIISVDGKEIDNTDRKIAAEETYSVLTATIQDIYSLQNAINKANNEIQENGMTLLEMINKAKSLRTFNNFLKEFVNEPTVSAEHAGVIERGNLINKFAKRKLALIDPKEIENLSNEIDIINTNKVITVDLVL